VKKTVLILFFIVGLICRVFADESLAIEQDKTEQGSHEENITCTPGEGITLNPLDIKIEPSTVFVVQGVPNPNFGSGKGEMGGSWVFYLQVDKEFDEWALAHIELKTGLGNSVQDSLNLFSNVNYNANAYDGNIKLRKYWYEQYFFENQLTVSVGKYNYRDLFAQNEYCKDDDIQFINFLVNRFPAIEWPSDYCFTIHAKLSPDIIRFFEFEFNFYEADADWKKIFKHGMYTWQINLKPEYLLNVDPKNWGGNYRLYSWINARRHTKLVAEGQLPSQDTKEINYGFGFSIDQKITEVYAVFSRLGWKKGDIIPADGGATLGLVWFAGAQMTGKYWQREDDVLSFFVGQDYPSSDYEEAGNPGGAEGHFEAYYNYSVNECLTIGPNIQLIWNPKGVVKSSQGDDELIFVYGGRLRFVF